MAKPLKMMNVSTAGPAKTKSSQAKSPRLGRFAWQKGYGAFSISPSHRPALERYMASQREHHTKVTFQDEFRRLLKKYQIPYDERYVWD